MAPLSAVPLKHKLTLIVMATSMAALLLVGACFLIYELVTTPQAVARNLSSLASVIASSSTAALVFDDQNAVQETLNGLRATPNITTAFIYRENGSPYAGYWRDGTKASPPQCLRDSPPYRHVGQYVEICQKIELRGKTIGTIALRSDLSEAYARLQNYATIVGLAFLASLLVGLLISWGVQRLVSSPILDLAKVARRVSQEQNYALRAQTENRDEIGELFDRFNEMLRQIEQRNIELKDAQTELQKHVTELQHEVVERRRAEETLAGITIELQRSNAELEQFAYVASHDLQEPLRLITGYSQLLAKRYHGRLDDTASEYIDFAVDGAKRMQELITDLLIYSRVGTRGKPYEAVDCELILVATLRSLTVAAEESSAKITHDPLPVIWGDAGQIGQLFQNLIGNSIKYCNTRAPEIHVSCQRDGDYWRFAVRDNGIGIDPRYADRVFVIFQRLHSKDEYPGTGIGLALCKKIIERHGGRIWLESQPGQGSIFYFTIPVVKPLSVPVPL
jgi:signal transduction histidine kinase